jgi:hypothetical protein
VFYPSYERVKGVGEVTATRFILARRGIPQGKDLVRTVDLEKHYAETGQKIGGPCEIRWAWKYNDLKPRVYYAQGGDAYFASRYIPRIAQSFCDLFPVSNKSTRYSTTRLHPITDHSTVFVYDYSSFTSELTELKHFMDNLAEFCRGTKISCIDTSTGMVQYDLGDILDQYNLTVNKRPEMDGTTIFKSQGERIPLHHNKSGMLGVYGNIVWSSALHGLFLAFLTGSFESSGVIGDDAAGVIQDDEWSLGALLQCLRGIGDVHKEKLQEWGPGILSTGTYGWQFVKRPLERISNRMYPGALIDLPLLFYVCDPLHDFHTQSAGSIIDRRKAIISQVSRLYDRLHQFESRLSEESIEFAIRYTQIVFSALDLPTTGALPSCHPYRHEKGIPMMLPILDRKSVSRPWIEVLTEELDGQTFTLPKFAWSPEIPESYRYEGQETEGTSHPLFSIGEDLGFIRKVMRPVHYRLGSDVAGLLKFWYNGDLRSVYAYTYTDEPPKWWRDVYSDILTTALPRI